MDVATRYCLAVGARVEWGRDTWLWIHCLWCEIHLQRRNTSRNNTYGTWRALPLLPRVRCAVSKVATLETGRMHPRPLRARPVPKCWKIYRVIGHFGMPEDWPDTIDEANWEKFIGGGGGEDRYADKCLYNITSIFNLHGQESSFERRYVYIYIYTHRSLSEGESISEMERRGGGKMEEEFSVAY